MYPSNSGVVQVPPDYQLLEEQYQNILHQRNTDFYRRIHLFLHLFIFLLVLGLFLELTFFLYRVDEQINVYSEKLHSASKLVNNIAYYVNDIQDHGQNITNVVMTIASYAINEMEEAMETIQNIEKNVHKIAKKK